MRLNVMTTDEVQWIDSVWISTWHGMIPFFKYVEGYMPDRCLQQFEQWQYILGVPIKTAEEHMFSDFHKYVVKNTFVAALWLATQGHNYFEIQMTAPAIPPSPINPGYMR